MISLTILDITIALPSTPRPLVLERSSSIQRHRTDSGTKTRLTRYVLNPALRHPLLILRWTGHTLVTRLQCPSIPSEIESPTSTLQCNKLLQSDECELYVARVISLVWFPSQVPFVIAWCRLALWIHSETTWIHFVLSSHIRSLFDLSVFSSSTSRICPQLLYRPRFSDSVPSVTYLSFTPPWFTCGERLASSV